jgi:hypothetical protein
MEIEKLIRDISLSNYSCKNCLEELLAVDPTEGQIAIEYIKTLSITTDQIWTAFAIDCESDPTRFLLMIREKKGIFVDDK